MEIEKLFFDDNDETESVRSGCGKCGGCSEEAGASANQATFGSMQAAQRQNKGC